MMHSMIKSIIIILLGVILGICVYFVYEITAHIKTKMLIDREDYDDIRNYTP